MICSNVVTGQHYLARTTDGEATNSWSGGNKMKESEIIERLLEGDEEFKKLYSEHRKLDDAVKELEMKGSLSIDEELEVKRLKKTKLALKDKMEEKIRRVKKGV
jgi:uncharacterized protein